MDRPIAGEQNSGETKDITTRGKTLQLFSE